MPPRTRVLVAPFPLVVPEEPLAREKLFPLLGLVRVPDARRGIDAACAMLRIGGAGHSAVIHSRDPRTIMAYGARGAGAAGGRERAGSTGSAGLDTNLAPTMTIGTGFFGRSSLGENLEPRHLVNWTRVAYANDPAEPFGDFTGLEPWTRARSRPPVAAPAPRRRRRRRARGAAPDLLEELRELVKQLMAELRSFIFIDQLQPQTMCYLGTWIRGRLPRTGHGGADHRDRARPRHRAADRRRAQVHRGAGGHPGRRAPVRLPGVPLALDGRGAGGASAGAGRAGRQPDDAMRPQILASKLITRIDHQHAFLINRNKLGSMALPGESLFVLEMQPASYAILATNEAEKAARIKVVDYRMIGATGRVYLTGTEADVRTAADAAVVRAGRCGVSTHDDAELLRSITREVLAELLPELLAEALPSPDQRQRERRRSRSSASRWPAPAARRRPAGAGAADRRRAPAVGLAAAGRVRRDAAPAVARRAGADAAGSGDVERVDLRSDDDLDALRPRARCTVWRSRATGPRSARAGCGSGWRGRRRRRRTGHRRAVIRIEQGRGHRADRARSGRGRRPAGARAAGGAHAAGARPRAQPGSRDREGAAMLKATVTGSVWATRRIEKIPGGAFLEVEIDGGAQPGRVRRPRQRRRRARAGRHRLGRRGLVRRRAPPIDALIIGSIDEPAEAAPAKARRTGTGRTAGA